MGQCALTEFSLDKILACNDVLAYKLIIRYSAKLQPDHLVVISNFNGCGMNTYVDKVSIGFLMGIIMHHWMIRRRRYSVNDLCSSSLDE